MANEHLSYAKESAFGVWTAPDRSVPVRTANLTGNQPLMIPEETGGGRGDLPGAVGEVSVGPGDVTGLLRPTMWGELIGSIFTTKAQVAAGVGPPAGFRNKLLIDDDIDAPTFSFQKRYRSDLAESIKGAKLAGFTIGARTREFATVSTSWVAKDSVASGASPGTWANGDAAPAVAATAYDATIPEAFKFYQGVLRLGGTTALTAGEIVVTGATARVDLDNIEVQVALNPATDAYGVNLGDRTLQSIDHGRREITVRFDPNFSSSGAEFYNAWKSGGRAVVELFFQGAEYFTGFKHEMKITLPHVVYNAGGMPELNAQYGLKRHTVEGRAFLDQTTGVSKDIGIVIQTTENLTI